MKKLKNKQSKRASHEMKAQNSEHSPILASKSIKNLSIINVKNTESNPDTTAQIIIQNKINYTPKISVIIPVYNVEEYLSECLDSVINQGMKEIEIICVDDGSTDNSLNILLEYAQKDNRITVLKQENLHAGIARNAGLAVAKGEYIHFLDSDDWVDDTIYLNMYQICRQTKADFIKFRTFAYDNQGKKTFNWPYADLKNFPDSLFNKIINFYQYPNYLVEVLDTPWNGLYLRNFLIKNNNYFDNLICANDTSFFYRCLISAKTIYISSEQHMYYRMNNNNSLIGIRVRNFDCQLKQYNIIDKMLKKINDTNIANLVRKKLLTSIITRMNSYINNKSIDNELKEQIKEQTKSFWENLSSSTLINLNSNTYYMSNENKEQIKVSIIIPVYNVEKYLQKCLNSLIKQTLKEIEIICINDGSTDSSLKILKKFAKKDHRINILNQPNLNVGIARNSGIKCAKGEYIAFVDPDDWVDSDMYEKMYNQAKRLNSDIVSCNFRKYNEGTKKYFNISPFFRRLKKGLRTIDCYIPSEQNLDKTTIEQSLLIFPCYCWNKIYKKELIEKFEIKFPSHPFYEDWLFVIKTHIKAQRFSYIDKPYYKYRYHKTSILRKSGNSRYKYIGKLLEEIKEYLISENVSKQIFDNFNYFATVNLRWVYLDAPSYIKASLEMQQTINKIKTLISEDYQKYCFFSKSNKKVLIIEINDCHGECIPGYVKYFQELGYTVDVLLNIKHQPENPLIGCKDINITYLSEDDIIKYLNTDNPDNYDVCFFNSNIVYCKKRKSIFDLAKHPKTTTICQEHRLENISTLSHKAICTVIKKFNTTNKKVFEVNPHYFVETKPHTKNKVVNFIIVGNIENKRKNYNSLVSAVTILLNKKITNFRITIIGKGNIADIPEDIRPYFDIKGRLSFPDMFNEMQNADYFLTLLDPDNKEHDRYIKYGTSGSFQLIYGFNIPCLIAQKFAKVHNFNDCNSIIYQNNNDLSEAMIKAISQTDDKYQILKNNLEQQHKSIYTTSLENLSKAINEEFHFSPKWKAYLFFPYYLLKLAVLRKKVSKIKAKHSLSSPSTQDNFSEMTYNTLSDYPKINADCFIPIGDACRPAYQLRNHNLRCCSLPFDWLGGCSLDFILKTIKFGIDDWFKEWIEDKTKSDRKNLYVYDTKNQFRSKHFFPIDTSVEDYLPVFRETFSRRYNRMIDIIKNSKVICFICNNRPNTPVDFYNFIKELKSLYPNKKWLLLHIKHSDTERTILKYQPEKNITIYNITTYDIHEKGNDKDKNPSFWKGNTKLWDNICSHLSFKNRYNFNTFKQFIYHKKTTDTYTKTYICGIRINKKPVSLHKFIDQRLAKLSKSIDKKIAELSNQLAKNIIELNDKIESQFQELSFSNPSLDTTVKIIAQNQIDHTPKVSVIIPVYNVEEYLGKCLDSVTNQTLKEIEIICIDDGSTDKSLEILLEYAKKDKRITILKQPNQKQGIARNNGIKHSTGKYIFFCDSDDWLEINCIEKLYEKITKDNTDLCIFGTKTYDNKNNTFSIDNYRDMSAYKEVIEKIATYKDIKNAIFCHFYPFDKLYKRELIINNNILFKENVFFEDVIFSVKNIILAKSISFLDENLYIYRDNQPESTMGLAKNTDITKDVFCFLQDVYDFLNNEQKYEELKKDYLAFVIHQIIYHIQRTEDINIKQIFIYRTELFITKNKLRFPSDELQKIYNTIPSLHPTNPDHTNYQKLG